MENDFSIVQSNCNRNSVNCNSDCSNGKVNHNHNRRRRSQNRHRRKTTMTLQTLKLHKPLKNVQYSDLLIHSSFRGVYNHCFCCCCCCNESCHNCCFWCQFLIKFIFFKENGFDFIPVDKGCVISCIQAWITYICLLSYYLSRLVLLVFPFIICLDCYINDNLDFQSLVNIWHINEDNSNYNYDYNQLIREFLLMINMFCWFLTISWFMAFIVPVYYYSWYIMPFGWTICSKKMFKAKEKWQFTYLDIQATLKVLQDTPMKKYFIAEIFGLDVASLIYSFLNPHSVLMKAIELERQNLEQTIALIAK